jgi:pimeloyl-ACP methyl ester carboxylesterase
MLKRLLIFGLMICMAYTFSGCKIFGITIGKDDSAATNTDSPDAAGGDDGGDNAKPADIFNAGPKPPIETYRPISVTLPQGLKLVGTLYIPGITPFNPEKDAVVEEASNGGGGGDDSDQSKAKPEPITPAKTQYPLVILLHMLSGERWDWKELPRHLVAEGYSVLALDLRGHGDSIYMGKRLKVWREFDHNEWDKMPEDVQAVLDYVAHKQNFNMVNTHSVIVIGAEIGANVGVIYGSKHPDNTKALVLLSPGLEYEGLESFQPMTYFSNPVYYIASKEDSYASDSTQRLYKFTTGKKKIQIFENLGHGTDILDNSPDVSKNILDWIKTIVPPPAVVPAVMNTPADSAKPAEQPKVAAQPAKPGDQKPAATASTPSPAVDKSKSATDSKDKKDKADKDKNKDKSKATDKSTATKAADKAKTTDKVDKTKTDKPADKSKDAKAKDKTQKGSTSPAQNKPASGDSKKIINNDTLKPGTIPNVPAEPDEKTAPEGGVDSNTLDKALSETKVKVDNGQPKKPASKPAKPVTKKPSAPKPTPTTTTTPAPVPAPAESN